MTIYHYNNLGFFTHSSEALFCPALATTTPPPEPDNGCNVMFLGGEWRQRKRHIPTQEELDMQRAEEAVLLREEAKQARQQAVDSIVVTVNGKEFDGDETSQTRMARAILGMQAANIQYLQWVLADNTVTEATMAELTEALILAGQRQSELWAI